MKIIFGTNNKIGSLAIRLFTWSKYHHVGIMLNDSTVLESNFHDGVRLTNLEDFKKRYKKTEVRVLPGKPEVAMKHIGKKYDLKAIVPFVFKFLFGDRKWNDPNKWFCSELVATAATYFDNELAYRVTPQDLVVASIPYVEGGSK